MTIVSNTPPPPPTKPNNSSECNQQLLKSHFPFDESPFPMDLFLEPEEDIVFHIGLVHLQTD